MTCHRTPASIGVTLCADEIARRDRLVLDVQERHPHVASISASHEVPELLRAADVEDLLVAVDTVQQRHEECEALTSHPCRSRTGRAVVGERLDYRASGCSSWRPRCVCHSVRQGIVRHRNPPVLETFRKSKKANAATVQARGLPDLQSRRPLQRVAARGYSSHSTTNRY